MSACERKIAEVQGEINRVRSELGRLSTSTCSPATPESARAVDDLPVPIEALSALWAAGAAAVAGTAADAEVRRIAAPVVADVLDQVADELFEAAMLAYDPEPLNRFAVKFEKRATVIREAQR